MSNFATCRRFAVRVPPAGSHVRAAATLRCGAAGSLGARKGESAPRAPGEEVDLSSDKERPPARAPSPGSPLGWAGPGRAPRRALSRLLHTPLHSPRRSQPTASSASPCAGSSPALNISEREASPSPPLPPPLPASPPEWPGGLGGAAAPAAPTPGRGAVRQELSNFSAQFPRRCPEEGGCRRPGPATRPPAAWRQSTAAAAVRPRCPAAATAPAAVTAPGTAGVSKPPSICGGMSSSTTRRSCGSTSSSSTSSPPPRRRRPPRGAAAWPGLALGTAATPTRSDTSTAEPWTAPPTPWRPATGPA